MLPPDRIYIYTDASFSKPHGIAVTGFALFASPNEHETVPISAKPLNIALIRESNNIRAELRGAIAALRACPRNQKVLLYTDCETVCRLPHRREKLERTNYVSQRKGRPLTNSDLYQEFFLVYDEVQPELVWLKGHSSSKGLNQVQRNFSFLDKEVRRVLRESVRCSNP